MQRWEDGARWGSVRGRAPREVPRGAAAAKRMAVGLVVVHVRSAKAAHATPQVPLAESMSRVTLGDKEMVCRSCQLGSWVDRSRSIASPELRLRLPLISLLPWTIYP